MTITSIGNDYTVVTWRPGHGPKIEAVGDGSFVMALDGPARAIAIMSDAIEFAGTVEIDGKRYRPISATTDLGGSRPTCRFGIVEV